MLRNLSLVYKVPLRVALLIVLVSIVIAASLLFRAYEVFREDLVLSAENLGRILARTVTPAILHDDVWKAYEVVNTPFSVDSKRGSLQPELVIVLDRGGQVYVSTQPEQYPMLTDPASHDPMLSQLVAESEQQRTVFTSERIGFENLYVLTPIESDGVRIGALILVYSKHLFSDRFLDFARTALLTTLLITGLLLPMGAYWGRKSAKPLVELANCMSKVGSDVPAELDCEVYDSKDELGQLFRQFQTMVAELQEKASLEQQVIVAERLAAIGRFTAGIAHEINNPLGGLLNATSTLRKHGSGDPLTEKTVSLLERGLLQIKDTVGALLVEASSRSHPLTHQDIEDTRVLVQQEASKKAASIDWNNALEDFVPLPSTLVRQILINLLLNAIQATPQQGRIGCQVGVLDGGLHILIRNEGQQITEETMALLFEPFHSSSTRGRGLGLWVTYQIVHKLNGQIEVSSGESDTSFTVFLPLQDAA